MTKTVDALYRGSSGRVASRLHRVALSRRTVGCSAQHMTITSLCAINQSAETFSRTEVVQHLTTYHPQNRLE